MKQKWNLKKPRNTIEILTAPERVIPTPRTNAPTALVRIPFWLKHATYSITDSWKRSLVGGSTDKILNIIWPGNINIYLYYRVMCVYVFDGAAWRSWLRVWLVMCRSWRIRDTCVSLNKNLYSYCLVLVGSRNGFEREFTIELK